MATWKYIPKKISIFDGKVFHQNVPVTTMILHPPVSSSTHPGSPIRGDWHYAEIITPVGTSHRGFADGYVTSGLRFAVKLGPGQERDEVIAKWKDAPPKPGSTTHHVNRPKWQGSEVQSLLFERPQWTSSAAKAWAKRHGYESGKVHTTTNHHRIRQFAPIAGTQKRTIVFGDGIKAVIEQVR